MSTKVAVVTGANKGIGFGIVRGLCKSFGGDVFLTARDEGRGKAAVSALEAEGLRPKFHQLDITDHYSIVRLRDFLQHNYGGLDVLVNNAAIAYEFNGSKRPPIGEEAEELLHVNFYSTLDVCGVLFPLFRPHARVCNVSSISGYDSLVNYSDAQKAKVRKPNITMEDVNALVHEFIEAAKKDQLSVHGFDDSAYGMSKIALSLASEIQQQELDKQGVEDIVVNSCDPSGVVGDEFIRTDMAGDRGCTIDEGSVTPLYCSLLPPNIKSPRGEFIMYKEIRDWKNGRIVDHQTTTDN